MKLFTCLVTITFAIALSGCGSSSNSNATANANKPAANANTAEAVPTPAVETTAPATTTGSLATPSDAYRTAYAMREKKDAAGLKKVMSKDVIEFLSMIGEEEKKSLDEQIAEIFLKPQAKTAEVRNEKINGDRATVEYLDEKGAWKTMDFVKEDGEWKMGLPPKEEFKVESGVPAKKP